VRRHEFLDLLGDLGALLAQRRELLGQSWQYEAGGVRAGDYDRLSGERSEDLLGEPAAEPWRPFEQPCPYLGLPGCGESSWGGPGLEQVQHGRVIQPCPRTRSSAGWIWVSSPRIRLLVAVICPARSSSNPDNTVSSAIVSSSILSVGMAAVVGFRRRGVPQS